MLGTARLSSRATGPGAIFVAPSIEVCDNIRVVTSFLACLRTVSLVGLCCVTPAVRAQTCAWTPSIETEPKYKGQQPTATQYTVYRPTQSARVTRDVMDATANGSLVSRVLRVITVDVTAKNFEMITGQDGLTFGIGDFARDSIPTWMQEVNQSYQTKMRTAFGDHIQDVLGQWIHDHNVRKNDNGLVAVTWLRLGLSNLLCDPEVKTAQLAAWRSTTVEPAKKVFDQEHFTLEISLASMIGIANSKGVNGMRAVFREAANGVQPPNGTERELAITRKALEQYATGDPHRLAARDDGAVHAILYEHNEVSCSPLGHRAKRVCMIAKYFNPGNAIRFSGMGSFSIESR